MSTKSCLDEVRDEVSDKVDYEMAKLHQQVEDLLLEFGHLRRVELQAPRRGIAIVAQGKGRFDRRPGSTRPKIYFPFSCFAPAQAGAKQEKGRVHYRIGTQGAAALCPGLLSFAPSGRAPTELRK